MKSLFDQQLQFTCVQATGEDYNPQKRTFLCLWVIFALLDPDPDPGTPLNPDPI
jgi:hypothetical protein